MQTEIVTIGLVDDHTIFREGLSCLLHQYNYQVTLQASDGYTLQEELKKGLLPDVLLLDIRMKGMDGFETLKWLNATPGGCRYHLVAMPNNRYNGDVDASRRRFHSQ